jgi:DNA helicase II / ATP-dependent DNA helicase PcrA
MQQEINVLEEDIKYAESILLPEAKTFDEERIDFIKNFETIDLQAVPGSGKTTALLAKLLILETKLPLLNNGGILILSHTNTAVNEIKEKIGKHCPKLFSYPNFIGTIQTFVDQFLAMPFYTQQFKKKIIRIDNEIYNEKISKSINSLWFHKYNFTDDTFNKISYIKNANEGLFYNYRFAFEDTSVILTKSFNESKLVIVKPRGNTRPVNYSDYSQQEKDNVYNWFFKFKSEILKEGILHFDDAYFLAETYLIKKPRIKNILQNRFSFVFVDEMQDVEIHQNKLLESVFYDGGRSSSIYQRIGDKNQAIFNGEVSLDEIWEFRDNDRTKNINGSQRLTKNVAELVHCLALSRDGSFKVEGKNETCNLKPHLIVYTPETIKQVIPKFSELIHNYISSEDIKEHSKNKYKAIGWIRDKINDDDKIGIKDYYDELISHNPKRKIDYENLDSYLRFIDKDSKILEPIRNNILNALIKILRLEDIYYSKNELLSYLEINHNERYIELEKNFYVWCINLVRDKYDEVYTSIKEYVPQFLSVFGKTMSNSSAFINNSSQIQQTTSQETLKTLNRVNFHGFDINISTVHSVKGETHTATLYLETYYQNGNDNYETERLSNQFKYVNFNKTQKFHKQSTKMAYVGFSRPTNLLCVAVCKTRFDIHLSDVNTDKWEVIVI